MGILKNIAGPVLGLALTATTALSSPAQAEGSSNIFNDCVTSGLEEAFPDSEITVSHSNDGSAITNIRVVSPESSEESHNLHLHSVSYDDNGLVNVAHASGKVGGERVEGIREQHPRTLGHSFFQVARPNTPPAFAEFIGVVRHCPTHQPLHASPSPKS